MPWVKAHPAWWYHLSSNMILWKYHRNILASYGDTCFHSKCYAVCTNMVAVPQLCTSHENILYIHVCDQIWENPAYCHNMYMAQCAFLVPQVKICRSPVYVILFISKNLSINLCHHLRRVNLNYQGEISLHFDLPSLYSCRTQTPLLRALIWLPAHRLSTARFIELLSVHSPFKLLRHWRRSGSRYQRRSSRLARPLHSFQAAQPKSIKLICGSRVVYGNAICATPLDHNFSFFVGVRLVSDLEIG